jgi:hypothetical protein
MSIADGPIASEPIAAEALTADVLTLTGDLTAPVGQPEGTITVVNHLTVPGCVVDFPT